MSGRKQAAVRKSRAAPSHEMALRNAEARLICVVELAAGCYWDLCETPVGHNGWDAHRAVLAAREAFRD